MKNVIVHCAVSKTVERVRVWTRSGTSTAIASLQNDIKLTMMIDRCGALASTRSVKGASILKVHLTSPKNLLKAL